MLVQSFVGLWHLSQSVLKYSLKKALVPPHFWQSVLVCGSIFRILIILHTPDFYQTADHNQAMSGLASMNYIDRSVKIACKLTFRVFGRNIH